MWTVTTVGELRRAIRCFTDECTIMQDNGDPISFQYKFPIKAGAAFLEFVVSEPSKTTEGRG